MNKYEKFKEMLDALNNIDSEGRINCIKEIRIIREIYDESEKDNED